MITVIPRIPANTEPHVSVLMSVTYASADQGSRVRYVKVRVRSHVLRVVSHVVRVILENTIHCRPLATFYWIK